MSRPARLFSIAATLALALACAWAIRAWLPGPWTLHHLERARLQAAAGHTAAARATLRELLRRFPQDRAVRWQVIQLEMQDRRFEPAYLEAKAYTELFPGATEGWRLIAVLMNGGGLPEEALAAAELAVATAPQDEKALAMRDALRARRPAGPPPPSRIHRGTHRERGEFTETHAMVWPGSLAELRRDADTALRAKDWAAAAEAERRARSLFPGSVIGPWLAGVAAMARGDMDRAINGFTSALVAAPRSALVVKGLAQAWQQQGGAALAGDRLMALVAADPGFAFARRHAANQYLNARAPDRAEQVLRAGTVNPGDAGTFEDLAAFYGDMDRGADALRACQDGLAKFPADLELKSRAAQLTAIADPAAAIVMYRAILAGAPGRTADALALARLLLDAPGGRAQSLELLREVERASPNGLDDVDALGWTLLRAGETRDAVAWLEPASQAAPDRMDIRYHLAAAYAKAGRKADALAHLEYALKSGTPFAQQTEAQKLLETLR